MVKVDESPKVFELPPQSPIECVPPAVKSNAPASERAKVMSRKSTLLVETVAPERVRARGVPRVDEYTKRRFVAVFPLRVNAPVMVQLFDILSLSVFSVVPVLVKFVLVKPPDIFC